MEKRRLQLLKRLIEQKDTYQPLKELAAQLNCSPRTLRTDLTVLSDKLKEHGFQPVERKPGAGVRLNEQPDKWKQLVQWSWEVEHASPAADEKERRLLMLYRLLMSQKPITLDSFAKQHYVSKPVIRKDLDQLSEVCASYDLTVQSTKNYGTTIEGKETNKRALLSHTVKLLSEQISREKALLQFFEPGEISIVSEALKQLQKKSGIQIAPESLEGLKLHTLFTIKRLYLNQPIALSEEKRNSIRGTFYYDWATDLAWMIQDKLAVDFPVNEVSYLALHFKSARIDSSDGKSMQKETHHSQWVADLVQKLVSEVSELLKLPLENDEVLSENLVLHLETTASRLESGFVISNPLLKQIKKEYVYLFHFIQSVVESYFEQEPIFLPEEEIGYLTVHFQAAVERQNGSRSQSREVGIVCHYGVGVSAFIQARLESRFPEIERTMILAEHEVDAFTETHPLSLIVSTVPLENKKVPVLMISPLLHDEELNKIGSMLEGAAHLSKENMPTAFSLLDYSQPFLIHLQKNFKNSDEVLAFMCSQLVKRGYVEEAYLDAVMEREARASTTIGKGIALPHGNPSLVNHSTISCVTLKEPMQWGTEKVSIIFLLAFKKEDLKKESAKGFFTYLHQIMLDPKKLSQLQEEQNVMTFLGTCSTI